VTLLGVVEAAAVASVADLAGNSRTRPFTRKAFGAVVLLELGFGLDDVAAVTSAVASLIP
jgi:hypothetical protein